MFHLGRLYYPGKAFHGQTLKLIQTSDIMDVKSFLILLPAVPQRVHSEGPEENDKQPTVHLLQVNLQT